MAKTKVVLVLLVILAQMVLRSGDGAVGDFGRSYAGDGCRSCVACVTGSQAKEPKLEPSDAFYINIMLRASKKHLIILL